MVSYSQFVAKVSITQIYGYKAKVRISCLFKGTTNWTRLTVHGINHPAFRGITGVMKAKSEAIIFANMKSHSGNWQLIDISGGLAGVWAIPDVTKALDLNNDSCPQPRATINIDINGTMAPVTDTVENTVFGTTDTKEPLQQCARAPSDSTKNICNSISYTWHASVWDTHMTKTHCDAVLISDLWVLTSARCVQHYAEKAHSLTVSLGVNAVSAATKSARANRVVLHPKWQTLSEHGEYDMALVKFNKPRQKDPEAFHVKPVCLADVHHTLSSKYKSRYFCCASVTNTSKGTVRVLYLKPPSDRKTNMDSKVLGDVYPIDQLRTIWASPVCEDKDGTLRVFQILSGTTDFKQRPVLTDISGQVYNWITSVVS